MTRLTRSITIIHCLGLIAAGIAGYGWNPPLAPHFIQACGCLAFICTSLNLFLGARRVDPGTIARAKLGLPVR